MKQALHILFIISLTLATNLFTSCSKQQSQLSDNCNEFEFKNLSVNTNDWKSEAQFEPINKSFFKDYILQIEDLKQYDQDSFYEVCEVRTDNMSGFVVAVLLGPTWTMYFIPESGKEAFVLAEVAASPDDYVQTKSKLIGESLEMTAIHVYSDSSLGSSDSTVTRYSVKKNEFRKIESETFPL